MRTLSIFCGFEAVLLPAQEMRLKEVIARPNDNSVRMVEIVNLSEET